MTEPGDAPTTDWRYAGDHLANVVAAVRDPQHPTRIGRYFIDRLIGEGGMGIVYRAEQREPIRRPVAVKIIKLGMDSREIVARFESERQALALMDHPNLAKIFDAGVSDTGRPYFVMEFVDGEPITSFCERNQLDVRQRLRLFRQACEAVQHAHQKAIIHRDLKPSNILVTLHNDRPWVKVIDFGVAKALGQQLTDKSLYTEVGRLMGTPDYMAPEQADACDVDTRSDVYSLGVTLYELLCGALPFDPSTLRSSGLAGIARTIREVEPPRPISRAVSAELRDQLTRELEWIPLKAIRKEPADRYSSAQEMSEDVENYLSQRPLRAGPESRGYRVRKFVRRNKAGVVAATMMILLLLAGIAATSWQAIRATRAEAKASQARDDTQATLDFLINDVLSGATPERIADAKVRDQIVKVMITPAADRVGEAFKDRPLVEANVRHAISSVLKKIGRADLALPHAERELAIFRRELGEDDQDTLGAINNCAQALESMGRLNDADPLFRQVLEKRRRLMGDDDVRTLASMNNYAHVLVGTGRIAEAEPLYRETVARRQRVSGNDDIDTILALNNLAAALRTLDRLPEAEPMFKDVIERYRRAVGENDQRTITAINNYAYVLKALGRRSEANSLFKVVYEERQRVLGPEHQDAIWSTSEYAQVLQFEGNLAAAEKLFQDALERATQTLGGDHYLTIKIMNNFSGLQMAAGHRDKAEVLLRDALERRRRVLGENHPDTLTSTNNYAMFVRTVGKPAEAEPLIRRAVEVAATHPSLGMKHRDTRAFAANHARILDDLKRSDEAEAVRKRFGLPAPATQPATQPSN